MSDKNKKNKTCALFCRTKRADHWLVACSPLLPCVLVMNGFKRGVFSRDEALCGGSRQAVQTEATS